MGLSKWGRDKGFGVSISLTLNTTNLSIIWPVVFLSYTTYELYELYESPLVLNPKGTKQKEHQISTWIQTLSSLCTEQGVLTLPIFQSRATHKHTLHKHKDCFLMPLKHCPKSKTLPLSWKWAFSSRTGDTSKHHLLGGRYSGIKQQHSAVCSLTSRLFKQ